MNNFISDIKAMFGYMGLTIVNPMKAFKNLKNDPRQIQLSIYCFLLMFIPFITLLCVGAIFAKIKSPYQLYINIYPDNFYLYSAVTMPTAFIMYTFLYSTVEIGSMLINNKNDFKYNFSIVTFAITMPWWLSFLSDAVSIIGIIIVGSYELPLWTFVIINFLYLGTTIWSFIITPIAIMVAKDMKKTPAIIIGIIGVLGYTIIESFVWMPSLKFHW
ncbi:MAG: hypothetical protein A2Y34_05655 [Spirochaetes bacterium GWC1_27_15]|nr:MAG: hypothetical protein A2Z98_09020 [Spirochaetes bacterium GWB1_27_13]OHD28117.1 MAG: hypothetical protein A2Y34_05655 [Spirochaetes bacterium GWC1_27_15]